MVIVNCLQDFLQSKRQTIMFKIFSLLKGFAFHRFEINCRDASPRTTDVDMMFGGGSCTYGGSGFGCGDSGFSGGGGDGSGEFANNYDPFSNSFSIEEADNNV